MTCSIATRNVDGIVIYDVSGRMSFPDPHIHKLLDEAIKAGSRGFIINLASVSYVDSYGLHDIVTAYNAVVAAGGRLVLLQPVPNVRKVIEITMKRVFTILDEESDALQAVRI